MKPWTRRAAIVLLIVGGYAVALGGARLARQHPPFTHTRAVMPDGQAVLLQQHASDEELRWRAVANLTMIAGASCVAAGIGWGIGRRLHAAWKRLTRAEQARALGLTGIPRKGP